MKINKVELFMNALICGLIVCSPLIGTYYGIKWVVIHIYNHTPKRKKEIQEKIQEIHRLEEQLGFHYDPYYYKNSERNNKAYLEDLREKAQNNYKAPDIIISIEILDELELLPMDVSNCYVRLLIHKDYYNMPMVPCTADEYFKFSDYLRRHNINGVQQTLSECGKYENYYVISIPGMFRSNEVVTGNDRVEKFIDDFRKKYKKTEHNSDGLYDMKISKNKIL